MSSGHVMMVNNEPFCIVDIDVGARNREFLAAIDNEFFSYVALVHGEQLDAEDTRRAATALRVSYQHGLETLFTLLAAAVQAPETVYAWAALCNTSALRDVVAKLQRGDRSLWNNLNNFEGTWDSLATIVFANTPDQTWRVDTAKEFARLWAVFAQEFLSEANQLEYNALKHGFRARESGFGLAIGREHKYGEAPPPSEMKTLGSSKHGSNFFAIEKLGDAPGDRNRRTRRFSISWSPIAMAKSLQLIDMSIANIVSFLRIVNGAKAGEAKFQRLQPGENYSDAWRQDSPVKSFNVDTVINPLMIKPSTKAELLKFLVERDLE